MTEEMLQLSNDQNIEYYILTLFEKIEVLRAENAKTTLSPTRIPIRVELRTLEFWRSVISECLGSFVYIFIVCGAAAGSGVGTPYASLLLATSLAAGFSMTALVQCFGHISGAQINPAVSIAMGITKKMSLLRTCMFVIAQCGGGIAGAACLYSVTVPGYQTNMLAAVVQSANVAPWERFGVEFILTYMVVFVYFVCMDTYRKWLTSSCLTIGATYAACTFVSMPYLNPARSLGPSFVLNRWESHWVYWIGPIFGGVVSAFTYEFVFNKRRGKKNKETADAESSSMHSDEDAYDDLDKPAPPKFHGSTFNTYRPPVGGGNTASGYCQSLTSASLYSAPPTKLERVESLYVGSKSLYCKSPPLTRANLNRSQSVYTKSNTGVHRDTIPKPGPLVPAQSLYPMRLNQPTHVQNQNVQNQLQQHSESVYGVRGVAAGTSTSSSRVESYPRSGANTSYPTRDGGKYEDNHKAERGRPESMYGTVSGSARRGQSAQSDDSSYGSYQGPSGRNNSSANNGYHMNSTYAGNSTLYAAAAAAASGSSSYHNNVQHDPPSSQY